MNTASLNSMSSYLTKKKLDGGLLLKLHLACETGETPRGRGGRGVADLDSAHAKETRADGCEERESWVRVLGRAPLLLEAGKHGG